MALTHGIASTYNKGCRCDPCRVAGAAARRAQRNGTATAPPAYTRRDAVRHFELSMAARDWMDDAACRHVQSVDFFPGSGEPCEQARAVCAGCPVIAQCLEHALTYPEHHGVWGGTTPRQRKEMRGRRRRLRSVS